MKGYWNKPAETAEALRGGWLHTGDLARVDADGYLTLVDRLKDMIITGGRNVYGVESRAPWPRTPASPTSRWSVGRTPTTARASSR